MPTKAASESWVTVWDGNIAVPGNAMKAVDDLAKEHHHVRAFRGKELGKLWYAVLRMGALMGANAVGADSVREAIEHRAAQEQDGQRDAEVQR